MSKLTLIVLAAFASFTFSWGHVVEEEKECHRHRRYPSRTGELVDVKCTDDGYYESLQCTPGSASSRKCACYHPEGAITPFLKYITTCKCYLALYYADQRGVTGCDLPGCIRTGEFQSLRCCEAGDRDPSLCYCQDTYNGQRLNSGDTSLICMRGASQTVRV